jgi:tripartite motif-containing protein 71
VIGTIGKYQQLAFDEPYGICADDTKLYVSDMKHSAVYIFNKKTREPMKVVTSNFNFPRGIAVRNSGELLVADAGNHQIQIFSPDGQLKHKVGSNGRGEGEFFNPRGILALPNDGFLVCDTDNCRVQFFDKKNHHQRSVGSQGQGKENFMYPLGAAYNPVTNQIAVADCDNNRIQMLDLEGHVITSIGNDNNVQLNGPSGVAFDQDGYLLVTEMKANQLQILDLQAKKSIATFKGFRLPRSVCCDGSNFYVVDSLDCKIHIY